MSSESSDKILVIVTGGTIDAAAYPVVGGKITPPKDARPLVNSNVIRYLRQDPEWEKKYHFVHLRPVDSKYMNAAYRHNLLNIIKNAPEKRVMLTMGTDCMAPVAWDIEQKLGEKNDKAVVFTGAMVPIANGDEWTDGFHNINWAIQNTEGDAPGVWITFTEKNNTVWHTWRPEGLRKNLEAQRFENHLGNMAEEHRRVLAAMEHSKGP